MQQLHKSRHIVWSSYLLLLIIICIGVDLRASDGKDIELTEVWLNSQYPIRHASPDSALFLIDKDYHRSLNDGDTVSAISLLAIAANIHGHQADYKDSYDNLWTALLLADAAQLHELKSILYINLGRYYGFFQRLDKTFEFYDTSLAIIGRLVDQNELSRGSYLHNHYARCATYREIGDLQLGRAYLDSCFLHHDPENSTIDIQLLKFEEAFFLQAEGKSQEALEIYEEFLPWIREINPAYQVLGYSYKGDAHLGLQEFEESEWCYRKALQISAEYRSHLDFTPLVYLKLSELYFTKNDFLNAYEMLKVVQELDGKYFDSRSVKNRPLLEIQDAFRSNQEKELERAQEQRLIQFENAEKVLFLQKTILSISLLSIILIGLAYLSHVRAKHRAEKQFIEKERELRTIKANEIVELKNKELAALTLRLIAKDEMLIQFKNNISQLKGNLDNTELRKITKSISINTEQNWEEFEARFVSVNQRFYNRLSELYPNLTQSDKKLCALIKLNFSSKDIAKLLAISPESVHTARYRLRKKMHMSREENLTELIAHV